MKREKVEGDVRGRLVLELTCGRGYNTGILARKDAKVTGVYFTENVRASFQAKIFTVSLNIVSV